MPRNEFYNTKQKSIILDAIKKRRGRFTIKEIHDEVKTVVGLTTIYRLIDRLVDEGRLSKNIGKDGTIYYQYLEDCNKDGHLYLKCDNCGDMMHVDCKCMNKMASHIFNRHGFELSPRNTIISGLCRKCSIESGVTK